MNIEHLEQKIKDNADKIESNAERIHRKEPLAISFKSFQDFQSPSMFDVLFMRNNVLVA